MSSVHHLVGLMSISHPHQSVYLLPVQDRESWREPEPDRVHQTGKNLHDLLASIIRVLS